jgi:starch synthase
MTEYKITDNDFPSVLMAASEMAPFAKTGGLADVMSALPEALAGLGAKVSVIMPAYKCVIEGDFPIEDTEIILRVPINGRLENGRILKTTTGYGIPVYLVKSDKYFDRENLYGSDDGDYPDNAERFVFFSRAVLEFMKTGKYQILHANDWQTALTIAFLKSQPFRYPGLSALKTVMTVHNLGYQGRFSKNYWPLLELDWGLFNLKYLEFYDDINFLKGGIVFADAITTVSSNYAEEIKTPEQGFGIEGLFRERADVLYGILNGVDYKIWDPGGDRLIPQNYDISDVSGKRTCKTELQKYFNLDQNIGAPLLGMVTRLSRQKGIDLVYSVLPELIGGGCQFVLFGSGDRNLQNMVVELAVKYPGKAGIEIGFRESLAHQIVAGSDIMLMPSLYEPGGLTQLYGLRYGTIPVVRATGGLKDTILPFKTRSGKGTGFVFTPFKAEDLLTAVEQAVEVFRKKDTWAALMRNAMRTDFSWTCSAREYMNIYQKVLVNHNYIQK